MNSSLTNVLECPQFEKSADEIRQSGRKILELSKARVSELAQQPESILTFDSTLRALDDLQYEESKVMHRIHFLQNVSPDEDLRKAAQDVYVEFQEWAVEKAYHKGLYKMVKTYAAKGEKLEGERLKLFNETLRDYRRLGLELPEDKQNQLQEIQKKLMKIETDFSTEINDYHDQIEVDPKDLKGLDLGFIEGLKKSSNGKVIVSLQYPEYLPVMEFCETESIRRELCIRKYKVAADKNVDRLNQMISLRDEMSKILGYSSYNHYVLEERMARAPENVLNFLKDFESRLKQKVTREIEELKKLKAQRTGTASPEIQAWDYLYYSSLYKKLNFNVDAQELKDFFPLENVLKGMFDVMGELFSVRFVEEKPESFYQWHSDVRLIRVDDLTGTKLGYFYLDLFPRSGKYGHAAVFTILDGKQVDSKTYRRPVAAMVCNFPKQSPSLLSHSEVETLFHEFGHILPGVLTRAEFVEFSGSSVAWDFVEAPSQILENWVWDADILNRIARHHKDPSRKISSDFVEKMNQAHKAGVALFYLRQVAFAKADLLFHADGRTKDSTRIMNETLSSTFIPAPDETFFQAGWGHMVGYASGYYGYAWADVMAADMFSFFKKNGLMNRELGKKLRQEIYEPGSSRDENASLEAFLGRPLSTQSFFENLGL